MMRVKKFRRLSVYDIGKTESYLSDMAKQGLFLTGMRQGCNIFEINEPADIEYRIEYGERALNKEMREMYEVSGWDHVCSYRGIHIFRAAASEGLVEIHTDPEEQSYTLKNRSSMLIKLIFIELILLFAMIAITIFTIRIGNTPVLNLFENNFIYFVNIALVVYVIYEVTREMQVFNRIKKRLQMGFYINHHEPWKKRSVSGYIVNGILAVLFILCIASFVSNIGSIAGYITGKSNYALTMETKLPVIRLNEIEKLESPELRTYITKVSTHPVSYVRVNYNVFMKEMEIYEEFVRKDSIDDESYTPTIRTNYYKVYLPFMVKGVMKDVLYKAKGYFMHFPEVETKAEKLDCKGVDEFYYLPSDGNEKNYFEVVARKKNIIIWMIYSGHKTRTEVMEATQELFE